jgi:streptogramin lyase
MHKHSLPLMRWKTVWRCVGFFLVIGLGLFVLDPFSAGQSIAITCDASTLREFSLATSGYPTGIAGGPDGNVWFTEYDANMIGKMTADGTTVAEYVLPSPNSEPFGITVGPDGNLWFTEDVGNRIGKITTAGVITEYPLPGPGKRPYDIVAGPDGNLWFGETGAPQNLSFIGKITTAGTITEYPVITYHSANNGIASGPDGNLWFTELGVGKIGKITTNGIVAEYNVPATSGESFGIAAGPDGNLWFTTPGGVKKISKITPSGIVTGFAVPGSNSTPFGVTAGSDGKMWFLNDVGKVAQITMTGAVVEYALPAGSAARGGITSGSDGNIWFAEGTVKKIGRISCVQLQAQGSSSSEASSSSAQSSSTASSNGASSSASSIESSSASSDSISSSSEASSGSSQGSGDSSSASSDTSSSSSSSAASSQESSSVSSLSLESSSSSAAAEDTQNQQASDEGNGNNNGWVDTSTVFRGHGLGEHASVLDFVLGIYGLQPDFSATSGKHMIVFPLTADRAVQEHAAICSMHRYLQQLLVVRPNTPDDYVDWIATRLANAIGEDPANMKEALLGHPLPAGSTAFLQTVSDQGCAADAYVYVPPIDTAGLSSGPSVSAPHMDQSHLMEPITAPSQLQINDQSTDTDIAFSVLKADGTVFNDYGTSLTKEMHLIIIRDDLRYFYHIHPSRDGLGMWHIPFVPDAGGTYWFYANFSERDGHSYALRFERTYPGAVGATGLTVDQSREREVDGYHFLLEPAPTDTGMSFAYHITDASGATVLLQNFMGAFGHSIIVSTNGYFVHSHPSLEQGGDPVFFINMPPPGLYRIFTQFQIKGSIHMVVFDWSR